MWSKIWLDSCVSAWGWLAQASPAAAPAAASPAAPAAPAPLPSAVGGAGLNQLPLAVHHPAIYGVGHMLLLTVYFVVCAALVTCVTFLTTKSEGLSGVIGGATSTTIFKGKKSSEEMLSMWTTRLAITFIAFSLVLWFLYGRTPQ